MGGDYRGKRKKMIEIDSSQIISKHNSPDEVIILHTPTKVSIHKIFKQIFKVIELNNYPEPVFKIESSLWIAIDENICDTISEADNNRLYRIREIT